MFACVVVNTSLRRVCLHEHVHAFVCVCVFISVCVHVVVSVHLFELVSVCVHACVIH